MSRYLTNLIRRTLATEPLVQPRIATRYEPAPATGEGTGLLGATTGSPGDGTTIVEVAEEVTGRPEIRRPAAGPPAPDRPVPPRLPSPDPAPAGPAPADDPAELEAPAVAAPRPARPVPAPADRAGPRPAAHDAVPAPPAGHDRADPATPALPQAPIVRDRSTVSPVRNRPDAPATPATGEDAPAGPTGTAAGVPPGGRSEQNGTDGPVIPVVVRVPGAGPARVTRPDPRANSGAPADQAAATRPRTTRSGPIGGTAAPPVPRAGRSGTRAQAFPVPGKGLPEPIGEPVAALPAHRETPAQQDLPEAVPAVPPPGRRAGRAAPPSAAAPTVHVTIGRVEVRATPAARPPQRPVPRAEPDGLDAYLRRRARGEASP